MTSLPTIRRHGQYSSVTIGPLMVWFSYKTMVAFQVVGQPRVVSENLWGRTTGKHLNWIDGGDKANRVSHEKFLQLWQEQGVANA